MKHVILTLFMMLFWALSVNASVAQQQNDCLFFSETVEGEEGFFVCDDEEAHFRTAFERWGLQKIGYPISRRYVRDGFVTQAFQKAIMQWRAASNQVVLVNIFDDLHAAGFDETLLQVRQTPRQLPAGWGEDTAATEILPFEEVIKKRQALLDERPALRATYFASKNPLTFYGLPTSFVTDMGNHYAIRLQRAVLQEWKEQVPWANAGEVTIANGGDIAKELGALPEEALMPQKNTDQQQEQASAGMSEGKVYLDSIEVRLLESSPVQVHVLLRGNLADSCTTLDPITQSNQPNNLISLNLAAKRPTDQVCLTVLVPFEETFALDLTGLTAGMYTVEANGMTATFELP